MSIQKFFTTVVKDKIYWNREILRFFEIKEDDIPVFLDVHQAYKLETTKKYNANTFQVGHSQGENRLGSYWDTANRLDQRAKQGRSESYYVRKGDLEDIMESGHSNTYNEEEKSKRQLDKMESSVLDDSKSFHIDIGRFKI